jgi:uncharacterized protein (TIGR03790 family)
MICALLLTHKSVLLKTTRQSAANNLRIFVVVLTLNALTTRLTQVWVVVRLSALCSAMLCGATAAQGLEPNQLAILVNKNSPESVKLGDYYAEKRRVPPQQILALDLPTTDDLSRARYAEYVVPTVKKWLADNQLQSRVRCFVVIYGVPLRVDKSVPTPQAKGLLADATESLAAGLAALQEIKSNLDAMPWRLPPIPPVDTTRRASSLGETGKVEERVKDTLTAYAAAAQRVKNIADTSAREQAQKVLADYRRALHGIGRVAGSDSNREQWRQLEALTRRMFDASASVDEQRQWAGLVRELDGLLLQCRVLKIRVNDLSGEETAAAFDSELSLLWWGEASLYRWQTNPLRREFDKSSKAREAAAKTRLVARLDGPTPEVVQRTIDDAIATEVRGLSGNIYIDARGFSGEPTSSDYERFDASLRQTARLLRDTTRLKVVLDNEPEVFAKGACPDAALYCGWYSLGKYVDAFQWARGAVGYHVASAEAVTLHQKNSRAWCKRMLEEGVCATVGPVAEPYLTAFPPPDEFFPLLLTGKWTLAECYYRATPYLSWMMTLIGDPLYRPFKNNPALRVEDLPTGLAIPEKWGE